MHLYFKHLCQNSGEESSKKKRAILFLVFFFRQENKRARVLCSSLSISLSLSRSRRRLPGRYMWMLLPPFLFPFPFFDVGPSFLTAVRESPPRFWGHSKKITTSWWRWTDVAADAVTNLWAKALTLTSQLGGRVRSRAMLFTTIRWYVWFNQQKKLLTVSLLNWFRQDQESQRRSKFGGCFRRGRDWRIEPFSRIRFGEQYW